MDNYEGEQSERLIEGLASSINEQIRTSVAFSVSLCLSLSLTSLAMAWAGLILLHLNFRRRICSCVQKYEFKYQLAVADAAGEVKWATVWAEKTRMKR